MFLEILTLGHEVDEALGPFVCESRMFIGPFGSAEVRDFFREHWERQLDSAGHNPNQVKFLSCDRLPDGRSAIIPRDFGGFQRVRPEDLENTD